MHIFRSNRPLRIVPAALAVIVTVALTGCGSDDSASTTTTAAETTTTAAETSTTAAPATPAAAPPCPAEPIQVVVSVDQWGDIVEQLAGQCAKVTTVITSSAIDPHDYEPSPADIASFTDAEIVVVNGCDYDHWADETAEGLNPKPVIVNACEVVNKTDGDNPHIWYGPDFVFAVAGAVTEQLEGKLPSVGSYFPDRAASWNASMQGYRDEIAKIKGEFSGRTYAVTESVFDYMGDALTLKNTTPEGFARAAANETDPSPGDVQAFNELLTSGGASVLVYNIQTEGSIPEQVRTTAEGANVPVVDVTETVAEGATSFAEWQIAQLQSLYQALSGQG
ncbi:MAG: metal ABC transporter solute-binding protein, Zn/Mn family [Actinomycetota bacterium]